MNSHTSPCERVTEREAVREAVREAESVCFINKLCFCF